MLDPGQYYGQQGYYPEWQAAGVGRGNGQAAVLSRPEAIRLYEINLAAYHETARRRDRQIWFFAAANIALASGLMLVIWFAETGFWTAKPEAKPVETKAPAVATKAAEAAQAARGLDPLVILACSCLTLVVGLPLCRAWKRALAQSREDRARALGPIRQLENDYALRYSPLGEETKPDAKAEQAAIGRELFFPRALGWAYLLVFGYVSYALFWDLGVKVINRVLNINLPGPYA